MARTKADVNEEVVTPEVAPVEEAPKAKGPRITFKASFKTISKEGDKITHKYAGSGSTVLEALNDVRGSDEDLVDEYGRPFPARINILLNVTATKGDYKFDRALASHVANSIFTDKNATLASRLFGL